jgi:uncharacterized protein YbjT (DUF2867 family)
MSTAVIGATGRVGSEIVRGILARGDSVAALVRDPDKARRVFGEPEGLHIRPARLHDRRNLAEALDTTRTVFSDEIKRDRGCPPADRDRGRRRDLVE